MNAQQLKNAILQEAIEGRLVPQDTNDEPASILLERIRAEKERLVKEGKLKKKDLEVKPISEDEIPFEIPESWEWCRVETIIYPPKYGTSNKSLPQGDVPVLRMGNIQDGEIVFDKLVYSNNKTDNDKYNLIAGDLLFNRTNSAELVGKTGIYRGQHKAIYAGYLILLRPIEINSDYLNYVLGSPYARSYCQEVKTIGVQQCNINAEKISILIIPLPPLAEQIRIVAKIEELLPKVEEYGKAQDELNKLNEELPEKLKKSILQEAIEGRLVPQDPNDEPASVLLEKIREEKKQLVKEGKLKKKDLEEKPISVDEIPFEIPESWEWCRLGDIGIFERGSGIKRDETLDKGYPCVRYGEMYTKYKYSPTFEITVSFTSKSVFEKCRKAHKGDLFMALTGENKQDISLAAQYVGEEEIAVGGDLCHFTILKAYPLYFVYLINSTYFSSKKEVLATGDIIVHISTDKLASIPIPFPPLAEQHRIVAKIEELLQKIEDLKK